MATPSYDWLDSMIWSVGISSILIGVAALRTKLSQGKIDNHNEIAPLTYVLLLIGVFLFVSGLAIGIIWPFPMSGGVYNVLFSGASALGGIVLLSISTALLRNSDLRFISYLAFFFGIYLFVAAYSIASYRLTRTPEFSSVIFALLGLSSVLSLPAVYTGNKTLLRVFGIVVIITGLLWLYEAANVTYGHLAPPPPTTTTPKTS